MSAPTQQRLAADPVVMSTWLNHLYAGQDGLISVCSDGDGWRGERFTTDEGGIRAAVAYAVQLDQRRRPKGIYAQVTTLRERPEEGRGGKELAHVLTHLWADGDFGTVGHKPGLDDLDAPPDEEAVQKVVEESPLPAPSGWTHSGGGYNAVWMLAEPRTITDDEDRGRVEEVTAAWQAILAAQAYRCGWSWDIGVGNVDRLMKLPGTVNRKEGLERPTAVGPGSGALYDFEALAAVAAQLLPAARETLAQADQEKKQREADRLGRKVLPPRPPRAQRAYQRSGDGPLDVIADTMEFRDVLEPARWTYQGQRRDGREAWLRPTAGGDAPSSEYSLLCDDHVAINWSERSGLPTGAQPVGGKLTVGKVYAYLNYGGDISEAARDIMRAAGGHQAGPAARLPQQVLVEVKRRCLTESSSRHGFEDLQPPDGEASPVDWSDLGADPSTDPPSAEQAAPRRGLLPEEFWEARPELGRIRRAAYAINRSPDVAFAGVLARLAALMPPDRPADTGVGSPASMNIFVALLGPSGTGKSSSKRVPRFLVPTPPGLDVLEYLPLGTGEGIAEAYMGEVEVSDDSGSRAKTKTVREQVRNNALFYADEGERLITTMFGRSGTTIGETLRTAWSGGTIGQFNGQKVNTRVVEEGAYSAGLIIGFQPETALPLFDDAAAGTPQRFMWFSTLVASLPEDPPAWPPPLELPLLASQLRHVQITFAEAIRKELRAEDRARMTGELTPPPLDSHRPLTLVKVAVLLAVLNNRANVTAEDWDLARIVWDASCQVRDGLVEQAARQRAQEEEQRTKQHVERTVRAHKAVSSADRNVERVARRIANRVHEAGGMTVGAARKDLASRDRGFLSDALDYAEAQGWTDYEGDKITPGGSKPS